ncbi:hypothetical protein ACEPAF_7661 [Sanghuangporus sanghuang]|uniref:DUF6699 domain-containing protein n=1 Tax=Sanghuangporus baumii TaxID=108892 RepID=A0A9Q5I0C1_SANBA|nr:hypothetical protein A7U60_g3441 [Sanghuangporus baumii]
MAYAPYYATPHYFQTPFYPTPQANAIYTRPFTPQPEHEHRKLRKKQNRWSLPGYTQLAQDHPITPPPTPQKPRRVLWETDYMTTPTSSRYPDLNPVLAADTTRVNFDVRLPPEKGVNSGAYARFWSTSALRRPTMHMRLISRDHPWVFELDFRPLATRGTPHYVTCGDVWTALTSGLSQPITDAEWSLFVSANRPDQSQRRRLMTETVAMRTHEQGKYLRRVDWLGRNVVFRGLLKDDNFTRDVLLPGRESCVDTWVVKFAEIRT